MHLQVVFRSPRYNMGELKKNMLLAHKSKSSVIFRNKRSQAKGVYYVFLYKQHMEYVYTRVAIHRFPLGSLVVGWSPSSPPQSWISTLAHEHAHCGSRILSQSSPLTTASRSGSLPPSLSHSSGLVGLQFLGLSRRSLQRLTHPIRVWILPY